ncbi:Unknown protein [Striga hermonthica]|uniref:Uncharacterized protein n=1 Tax=Striga hermonthica TaxID=68872 RepID=A0A9N7N4R9_STRHE|nr:Unknown protein [Striga hermonthica]
MDSCSSSIGTSLMTVFAVSGSVVFVAMQAHKRLLSNFFKDMEFEFNNSTGGLKGETKKKVRFAGDVIAGRNYSGGKSRAPAKSMCKNVHDENLEAMPKNWQVMYRASAAVLPILPPPSGHEDSPGGGCDFFSGVQ